VKAAASLLGFCLSVNILIDTIFVGQWIVLLLQAVTVVLLITFLISFRYGYWCGRWFCSSRALKVKDGGQNHFCQSNYDDLYFMSLFVVLGIFSVLKCYCFCQRSNHSTGSWILFPIISVPFWHFVWWETIL
jgi:hypothetical protein